jgi:hypothetical protein
LEVFRFKRRIEEEKVEEKELNPYLSILDALWKYWRQLY